MSDFLAQCSVRARRAAACFAFFFLCAPPTARAQGTPILTLLSTEGRELKIGDHVRGALSAYVVGPGLESLENDDGGDGLNSRLDVTFPNDGTYRVVASSLGGSLGTFTLRVR
ncbi:MAG TPA: hypothetical protein EYQ64_03305 [Gemmatimonadetes bacterium]|nr:hypothetical protein [Gemmatimonadota bacterium]